MPAFDYKKAYKDLYLPKAGPAIVDVPEMRFIMVDGRGDPNTSASYKATVEVLYGLSYAIKMSNKSGTAPEGCFEYVVPPLEGLWWLDDEQYDGTVIGKKDKFLWTMMIRQPEFVTTEAFETAKRLLAKKKPELDTSVARLEDFAEGLCGQILHVGAYDDEPPTIRTLEQFVTASGYQTDLSEARRHHEIYLSDPRKTAPDELRTVIRHPIAIHR